MSQNVDIGPSLVFMSKTGRVLIFVYDHFSRFYKIKTRTYITKSETRIPPN